MSREEMKGKLDRARERYKRQEDKVLDLSRKLKEAQKKLVTDAEVSRAHAAYARSAHFRQG
jgi:hypothetical protein